MFCYDVSVEVLLSPVGFRTTAAEKLVLLRRLFRALHFMDCPFVHTKIESFGKDFTAVIDRTRQLALTRIIVSKTRIRLGWGGICSGCGCSCCRH